MLSQFKKGLKTTLDRLKRYSLLLLILLTLLSCKDGESSFNNGIDGPEPPDNEEFIAIGSSDTFEAVTWNLHYFPSDDTETIDLLKNLIPEIGADVYAIQEVDNRSAFYDLVDLIPDYEGVVMNSDSYLNLGFIYNTREVNVVSHEEIMPWEDYFFVRIPLMLHVEWQGFDVSLINVHFKANDDGFSDDNRRRESCNLLDEYISQYYSDRNVIVLGDMNDELTDPVNDNVFTTLLSQPEKYLFADMAIAESMSTGNASYPSYPSHIDHILVTNELYPALEQSSSLVKTLLVENFIEGGMGTYRNYISDHRPVAIKLDLNVPDELKVITWNIESFPKSGETTTDNLNILMSEYDADFYGIQEIADTPTFLEWADTMDDYTGYVANYFVAAPDETYNPPVGCLVKSSLEVTDVYTILPNNYIPLPRLPLVVEARFGDEELVFINIHLKAAGDNVIDYDDEWDQENRRLVACSMLDEYISTNFADKQVILMGDMNDQLQEPSSSNVFEVFLNSQSEYRFTDLELAQNPSSDNYSYPMYYPALIDHILITNELFDNYQSGDTVVLKPDVDEMNWNYYEANISDHRPVQTILKFD